jgi:hypothetical protein
MMCEHTPPIFGCEDCRKHLQEGLADKARKILRQIQADLETHMKRDLESIDQELTDLSLQVEALCEFGEGILRRYEKMRRGKYE